VNSGWPTFVVRANPPKKQRPPREGVIVGPGPGFEEFLTRELTFEKRRHELRVPKDDNVRVKFLTPGSRVALKRAGERPSVRTVDVPHFPFEPDMGSSLDHRARRLLPVHMVESHIALRGLREAEQLEATVGQVSACTFRPDIGPREKVERLAKKSKVRRASFQPKEPEQEEDWAEIEREMRKARNAKRKKWEEEQAKFGVPWLRPSQQPQEQPQRANKKQATRGGRSRYNTEP
jgi:hypothetical protein